MTTRAMVLAVGLGAFLLAGPAHAATAPVAKCKDTKAKEAGKKAASLLKAFGKNISKNPDTKLGANISKAQSKFTKGFSKAEAKGACVTNGDSGTIEAKIDDFVFRVIESQGATCGNGIRGGAEECDAGNGDGQGPSSDCLAGICNAGCACARCGDGILIAGEDCDEGALNGTSTSCCAADCTFKSNGAACDDGLFCTGTEMCDGAGTCVSTGDPCPGTECNTCQEASDACFDPIGTGCTDDGNVCTDDQCNGAGACTHANNTAACDDGLFCNGTDTCSGGACTVHAGDPCAGGAVCNTTCNETLDNCVDPDGSTPVGCDNVVGCSSDSCQGGVCTSASSCCTGFSGLLRFETAVSSGFGGTLQNFRCTNANVAACVSDADCDFGYCFTMFGICTGDTSISCTSDADCAGTCAEQTGVGLPLSLENGGLYTGAGKNSVPLPLPIPDKGVSFTSVTACNPTTGALTLGPVQPSDLTGIISNVERHCTAGRHCSTTTSTTCVVDSNCPASETCVTECTFGPQLPIPNTTPGSEATSVCTINAVASDAGGSAQCDGGDTDMTLGLRALVFLNGDLLSSSTGPTNVPGIQPCPLCTRQCSTTRGPCESDPDCTACSGGTNAGDFCVAASDCDSGVCAATAETCSAAYSCLGGPGDGNACAPETSGPNVLTAAFPTSLDCSLDPLQNITGNIGGLPVSLGLTTGQRVQNATDFTNQRRAFFGFCRDDTSTGSLCFQGDTSTACPVVGDGNAVGCLSDADCSSPFESCEQRNPGAFSRAAATRITVTGAAGECSDGRTLPCVSAANCKTCNGGTNAGDPCVTASDCDSGVCDTTLGLTCDSVCLGDGAGHSANLVSVFPINPTFNSLVDSAGDLPGPGAALISGTARLLP